MAMEELIEAAKHERWKFVDSHAPQAAKNDANVVWAYTCGLKDSDGNVRDLAATLLVKARLSKQELQGAIPVLRRVMSKDSNPYARYRAAFALAEHGNKSQSVINVLREATNDKDVADEARKYLQKLSI